MTTVLISVDETDSSVHAVETAHRLFGDSAEYLVLNVGAGTYVPIAIFPGEMGLISPLAWSPRVQAELASETDNDGGEVATDADAAETIAKLTGDEGGLPGATALGVVGDPANTIIDVALEHSADVIVVGTHRARMAHSTAHVVGGRRGPPRVTDSRARRAAARRPRARSLTVRRARQLDPSFAPAGCDLVDGRAERRLGHHVGDPPAPGVVVCHVPDAGEQLTAALDQTRSADHRRGIPRS